MKINVLRYIIVVICTIACVVVYAQEVAANSIKDRATLCLLVDSGEWAGVRAKPVVSEDGCLEVTAEVGTYGWVYKNLRVDLSRYSRLVVSVRQTSGIFNIKVLNLKGDNAWVEILRTREVGQHIVELPVSGGEKNVQVAIYLTGGNAVRFDGIRLVP